MKQHGEGISCVEKANPHKGANLNDLGCIVTFQMDDIMNAGQRGEACFLVQLKDVTLSGALNSRISDVLIDDRTLAVSYHGIHLLQKFCKNVFGAE